MTLFKCHNETFNVWSHLVAKICYMSIFITLALYYENMDWYGQ